MVSRLSFGALVAAQCISGRDMICPAHIVRVLKCSQQEAYLLLRRAQRDGLVVRAGHPHHAKWRIK
ncbi:MAG TPA: hypothetical protein VKY62_10520 [Devosia sp.]|nr:hypothetical protein [Devosia sp.]